jgi:hypothetical protein
MTAMKCALQSSFIVYMSLCEEECILRCILFFLFILETCVCECLHICWYSLTLDDISSVISPRIFVYVQNTLLWDTPV